MRVVILGGKGQLGRDLARACPEGHDLMAWDLPELDICNYRALNRELLAFHPALILNAAAYTNVEQAEEEPEAAYAVNEYGARNVAAAAAALGIPVVYYSTDFIFDGARPTPYTETDTPCPLNIYGKSKLAGEQATQSANERHYILRTAWLFGPGGNNFVEKIRRLAAARDRIRVVRDETGSPTHTWDLAEVTWRICATGAYGVYNAVNAGACSRFELARAIIELADPPTIVEPCFASEMPVKTKRPACVALTPEKLEQTIGAPMRPWREALAHYLQRGKETP